VTADRSRANPLVVRHHPHALGSLGLVVSLAAATAGCNNSRRACAKLEALEDAERGGTRDRSSPVLEQLARTQREICVIHLDTFKQDGDDAYAKALACADLDTSAKATACLDALSGVPPKANAAASASAASGK
jgi:hypothetical protein